MRLDLENTNKNIQMMIMMIFALKRPFRDFSENKSNFHADSE